MLRHLSNPDNEAARMHSPEGTDALLRHLQNSLLVQVQVLVSLEDPFQQSATPQKNLLSRLHEVLKGKKVTSCWPWDSNPAPDEAQASEEKVGTGEYFVVLTCAARGTGWPWLPVS